MSNDRQELPPIESWWPGLSIEARHALLEDPTDPLSDEVRTEIERLTGQAVAPGTLLDEHETAYIATQQEPVD